MTLRLEATPEQLRERFASLRTAHDVAALLDVRYEDLKYHLYISRRDRRYNKFTIPKASGGVRTIMAPATALKIIQRKLAQVLSHVYQPKSCVHGFVAKRSIVSNARRHIRRRYVFNVDLEGFFPAINFGRVRGMFMAAPYNLPPTVATVIAQICCFENQLPQGAPTSPIVSNMLCGKLDGQLRRLAVTHRCAYSRYADDLSFSTSMSNFSAALAHIDPLGRVSPGQELARVITENGFSINASKVWLFTRNRRQQVTGLTVNKSPNVSRKFVRQIRAMLHAWQKFGLDAAQQDFWTKYDKKHRGPHVRTPSFKKVVKGKIDYLRMVKGRDDAVYLKLIRQYAQLDDKFVLNPDLFTQARLAPPKPSVITEGKTDWKHLKNALRRLKDAGQYATLELALNEYEHNMGDIELLKRTIAWSKRPDPNPTPIITIFDRDVPGLLRELDVENQPYKDWGNNVYSFAIPEPDHRLSTPGVSIELYYTDAEIKRTDLAGRRLFLNTEFHPRSARHLTGDLTCTNLNLLSDAENGKLRVIDNRVFDSRNKNVALPKEAFANYVLSGATNFDDFDVSQFGKIFDLIQEILSGHGLPPS